MKHRVLYLRVWRTHTHPKQSTLPVTRVNTCTHRSSIFNKQEKYNSSNSTQTDKTPTHEHLYSHQYYHINSIANSCTSVNNASTCAYIKVLRVTIYKLPPCGVNNAGTGVTNTDIGTYNDVVNRCLEFVPYPAYPFLPIPSTLVLLTCTTLLLLQSFSCWINVCITRHNNPMVVFFITLTVCWHSNPVLVFSLH